MTIQKLTAELLKYFEDFDWYDYQDNIDENTWDDTYYSLLNSDKRKTIISVLKENIQECDDIELTNKAITLIKELNRMEA